MPSQEMLPARRAVIAGLAAVLVLGGVDARAAVSAPAQEPQEAGRVVDPCASEDRLEGHTTEDGLEYLSVLLAAEVASSDAAGSADEGKPAEECRRKRDARRHNRAGGKRRPGRDAGGRASHRGGDGVKSEARRRSTRGERSDGAGRSHDRKRIRIRIDDRHGKAANRSGSKQDEQTKGRRDDKRQSRPKAAQGQGGAGPDTKQQAGKDAREGRAENKNKARRKGRRGVERPRAGGAKHRRDGKRLRHGKGRDRKASKASRKQSSSKRSVGLNKKRRKRAEKREQAAAAYYRSYKPIGEFDTDTLVAGAAQLRARGWKTTRIVKKVYAPFIIAGPAAWTNTWGAPRYGPGPVIRTHEGQDVFCNYGDPVLASVPGEVEFDTGELGGRVARVHRPGGAYWYYAHLSDWNTQELSDGDQVVPGDVIGYCGNSGNAIATPPHVHFGWYRPSGASMDPMRPLVNWLRAAEEDAGKVVGGVIDKSIKQIPATVSARRFGDSYAPDLSEYRAPSALRSKGVRSHALDAFALEKIGLFEVLSSDEEGAATTR